MDGTQIRANASQHKAMSYGRMKEEPARLKAEIGELLQRAERLDRAEDERLGVAVSGETLPEELKRREERLAKIETAKARLEARQREADASRGRHEDDECKQRSTSTPSAPRPVRAWPKGSTPQPAEPATGGAR